jgi:ribosomal protein S17
MEIHCSCYTCKVGDKIVVADSRVVLNKLMCYVCMH